MEVGCGRGLASLVSARHGARKVVATDLNPYALRLLAQRARHERLPIDVVRTDLMAGIGRVDLVLSNPPYLPTTRPQRDPNPWQNLALDGGPDGCKVTARLLGSLANHLAPGGRAYVVVSSRQSPRRLQQIRAQWRRDGGVGRTVAQERWGTERLSVWRLSRGSRRIARSTRGIGVRRPARRASRRGSNRDAGSDRTSVRGAA